MNPRVHLGLRWNVSKAAGATIKSVSLRVGFPLTKKRHFAQRSQGSTGHPTIKLRVLEPHSNDQNLTA